MTPREKADRCVSMSRQIKSLTIAADCVQTGDSLIDPNLILSIVIDMLDVIEHLAGVIESDSGDVELALLSREIEGESVVFKPS